VNVSVVVQPFVFIYVITLVPADTAVTKPVLLIVATPGVADDHGVVAWAVALPVSWEVPVAQADNVPDTVGFAFTVTTTSVLAPSTPLIVSVTQ